jgi:hypothetical protein
MPFALRAERSEILIACSKKAACGAAAPYSRCAYSDTKFKISIINFIKTKLS